MIKARERAILKASEETVFVLALEGNEAVVRRPVYNADKGLYHVTERFFLDELETIEEHILFESKTMKTRINASKELAKDEAQRVLNFGEGEDLLN